MKQLRTVVEGIVYFPLAIVLAFPLGLCLMWDAWKGSRDKEG
ncbi:MAG TPA: hypothetical protein VD902_12390 [Symbiobacteriaceae bacterium]|nr:hypothetical protein [Symbiobacteriaceae bacterium]